MYTHKHQYIWLESVVPSYCEYSFPYTKSSIPPNPSDRRCLTCQLGTTGSNCQTNEVFVLCLGRCHSLNMRFTIMHIIDHCMWNVMDLPWTYWPKPILQPQYTSKANLRTSSEGKSSVVPQTKCNSVYVCTCRVCTLFVDNSSTWLWLVQFFPLVLFPWNVKLYQIFLFP